MKNIKSIDIISTELDNYSIVSPGINTGIREPDIVTGHDSRNYSILANSLQEMAQNMVDEYTMIYESIKQYDGFYIGRYELTGTVENPTLQKGQKVLRGEKIATVGSTGSVNSPQLHFEVRAGKKAVNPRQYLP